MNFAQLFNIAGLYVVPFWICIIILPNWRVTKKLMKSPLPFIPLVVFYVYYFIASFNIESFLELIAPQLKNFVEFISQDASAGSIWVHILLMDLFVGRWIYLQGQEKKIWTTHSLILCPMAAPVGLLSHIITAYFFDKNNNSDDDDSNLEEAQTDTAVS